MTQLTLGAVLKEHGQRKVSSHCEAWLRQAQAIALQAHRNNGPVSTDDLRPFLPDPPHPNAWGCVFKGPQWRCVGRTHSTHPSNHHREIRVWALA